MKNLIRYGLTLMAIVFCSELLAQNTKNISHEMFMLQESNYVHFNKPYFYAGERVWFNAYMLYADRSLQDSLSKVLYADLIDPNKTTVQQFTYKIDDGIAFGDFHLPDSLKSGCYFLRVYTNWMRNYGDSTLQYYPLWLLDKNQIPLSATPKLKKCDYLTIISDTLKSNSTTDFHLNIPLLQSYSLAIVDTFFVKRIPENYLFRMSSQFPENHPFQLKYILERGLTIRGKFSSKKNKKLSISALRKEGGELSILETDEKGSFTYQWEGERLSDNLVLSVDSRTIIPFTQDTQSNPEVLLPAVSELKFENTKHQTFQKDTIVKDAIALQEVVVKEKRIEEKLAPLTNLYGKPDNIVKGEDIQQAQVDNPLLALQGRVPGLRVFFIGGEIFIDILGSSQSSFTGKITNPQILLDGVPFAQESLNQVAAIPPYTIQRIEIVKNLSAIMGSRASSGVINIITKQTGFQDKSTINNEPNNVYNIPLKGFEPTHAFQVNGYTIFWQPNGKPDNEGNINIHFKTGKIPSVYRIELIGILTNGNLIKCYKNVVLREI